MGFLLESFWNSGSSWAALDCEFDLPYMSELSLFLGSQPANGLYPDRRNIFKAFDATPLDKVKVVIVGQDPYTDDRATGLAFSIPKGEELPPTLRNILVELEKDFASPSARSGDLSHWAAQGVLLLNSVLTVRATRALPSHRAGGRWTRFTNRALKLIDEQRPGVVFCLWGAQAESKRKYLVHSKHVLTVSHPSPKTFQRPFRRYPSFDGCRHFSLVNRLLEAQGGEPIHW